MEKTENNEEEYIKRFCDPCKLESKRNEGQGYCATCREYLCENCEKYHKKFPTTKSHRVVHGVKMPKPVRKTMSLCELHENVALEYYCKEHEDVICEACKDTKHIICRGVVPLGIYWGKEVEKEDLDNVAEDLKFVLQDFESFLAARKVDMNESEAIKENSKQIIVEARKEFNDILDRLEQDLITELDKIHSHEYRLLVQQVDNCENAINSLNTSISNVLDVQKTENNLASFATLIKGKKRLTEYRHALVNLKKDAHIVKYQICLDETEEIKNRFKKLGEIKVDKSPKTFYAKLNNLKKTNMKVVDTKVYSVRMEDDDNDFDCEITGSAFMADGSLIICDKHNQKIKLLDHEFTCRYDKTLAGSPWEVAVVNDNWVLATLPFLKKLQFLHANIDEGLRTGRSIQMESMCWGVAVTDEELVVSCHDNPGNGKICILDKRGHVKKSFGGEAEGVEYLFDTPCYISVNKANDKIYIADGDLRKTVTCITKKRGTVVFDYSANVLHETEDSAEIENSNLWSFKILVDDDEFTYAYLGGEDMIQVVTDSGTKYKTLLATKHELTGPRTLAYRESDTTLVIGLWDNIQIFRFKEIPY